jgi:hypothetical protein
MIRSSPAVRELEITGSRPHLSTPSADMPVDFAAVTKARLAVIATNATLRNAAVALSSPRIGLVIICEENGTGRWRRQQVRSRPTFDA